MVKIAGDIGLRKSAAGFLDDVTLTVTTGDMRQDQSFYAVFQRQSRSLFGGQMTKVLGGIAVNIEESRFDDQSISASDITENIIGAANVANIDHFDTLYFVAQHHVRLDEATIFKGDSLTLD